MTTKGSMQPAFNATNGHNGCRGVNELLRKNK